MNAITQYIKQNNINYFLPIKIDYKNNRHIPSLDGWRGVSVSMIVLFHCFPSTLTRSFWVAMDLFFVLSGFLITGILLDTKKKKNYYKNYITRRVLRIFPIYYFVLFLFFCIVPYFSPQLLGPDFNYYLKNQAWFWLYGQNWLFSTAGFPEKSIMAHFWSLAVEEQFYLLWPFVISLFNSKALLKVCIIFILFSIYFRLTLGEQMGLVWPYPYVNTLSRMDSLSIGALIAIMIRYNKSWLEKYIHYFALFAAFFSILGVIYFKSVNLIALPPIYTLFDILAGCILLYSLSSFKPWIIRIGDYPAFKWLGKHSYGIYIYHYIILNILIHNFEPRLISYFSTKWVAEAMIGCLTIILAIGTSFLSYRYIESPFLKLKKYFSYDKSSSMRKRKPLNSKPQLELKH